MSNTFQKFDKAALDVKKLKSLPSNDDLLILYAFFKQGTVGDVNTGNLAIFTLPISSVNQIIKAITTNFIIHDIITRATLF